MNEYKTIELTKDYLDEVAGGGDGKPKQDFGKKTVNCTNCGAENELPKLISSGMKLHCSACGTELEI